MWFHVSLLAALWPNRQGKERLDGKENQQSKVK
jgi:hypothetical protein